LNNRACKFSVLNNRACKFSVLNNRACKFSVLNNRACKFSFSPILEFTCCLEGSVCLAIRDKRFKKNVLFFCLEQYDVCQVFFLIQ